MKSFSREVELKSWKYASSLAWFEYAGNCLAYLVDDLVVLLLSILSRVGEKLKLVDGEKSKIRKILSKVRNIKKRKKRRGEKASKAMKINHMFPSLNHTLHFSR